MKNNNANTLTAVKLNKRTWTFPRTKTTKSLILIFIQKSQGNCVQRLGIQEVARIILTYPNTINNISNNTINQLYNRKNL